MVVQNTRELFYTEEYDFIANNIHSPTDYQFDVM